jgi:hypothetical protein
VVSGFSRTVNARDRPKGDVKVLRGARRTAKNWRATERAGGKWVSGGALKHGPLEPANFLRGMSVDDRDVIGGVDDAALAFRDVDAAIEAEERRAAVVRCERSSGAYQRGHDEQRKHNRHDRRASAFVARVEFSRRWRHDVRLL